MKYRLNFSHRNQKNVLDHAGFFKQYGMDPYGIFEEYKGKDVMVAANPKYHVVLKMSNYHRPCGLFSRELFVPAEAQTKLEDWL